MGTSNDEQATAAILDAARGVFNKYGLQKTTVEDIAKSAGKAKSSLYYYFKNKDEIFRQVILKESDLFFEHVEQAMAKERDIRSKLKIYINLRLMAVQDFINQNEALSNEFINQKYVFIEEFRMEQDAKQVTLLVRLLKDAIDTKQINERPDHELELIGYTLLTAIKGFEIPMILKDKCSDIKARVNLFTDIFLDGLVNLPTNS